MEKYHYGQCLCKNRNELISFLKKKELFVENLVSIAFTETIQNQTLKLKHPLRYTKNCFGYHLL